MALHSKVGHVPEAGMCAGQTATLPARKPLYSEETRVGITSNSHSIRKPSRPLRRQQLIRLAVLSTLCDPPSGKSLRMLNLSRREWRKLLEWLDISGLALYFLDQLAALELSDLLPHAVRARLYRNLIDNTQRTRSMISESIAIQQSFQKEGLAYANLKGLSLCPNSVPKLELRSQFDLDFLVAATCIEDARDILERRGYRLYAISGRSWEFKFNERPGISLKEIYKDFHSYAVELHVESSVPGRQSPLERLESRPLRGMSIPVLSPVDLLLGQGLHAFKHLCGESSRAAHLLEFRRHVLNRREDSDFWCELQARAQDDPRAALGFGVVILLITRVMGAFAPPALMQWTVDRLPKPVQLWVDIYGHRIALGSYPGTKLYLLLQQELEAAGLKENRPIRSALFPARLPPPVIQALPNEPLRVRVRRYSMHLQLILERARFHAVEGLRFALESRRWRRMKEQTQ